jgi:glycosyltransferase involved in cell wall biosynthesis
MPPVRIIVVVDDSTDDTARVAAAAGAEILVSNLRNAGAARAAGFDRLTRTATVPLRELWLATTDADSRVPPHWLDRQMEWRSHGWDAVVGTVVVEDWSDHRPETQRRFSQHYGPSRDGHPHVHGANLGLSAAAYCQVGGFPPVEVAEDHALVMALSRSGSRIARPGGLPVVTSARRDPRAHHGFGSLLCSMD